MAKKQSPDDLVQQRIDDIKKLDSTFSQLMRDTRASLNGVDRSNDINSIMNRYNELINQDTYNFNKNKTISQSSYSYMANMLVGKPLTDSEKKDKKKLAQHEAANRQRLEELFTNGDMMMAGHFLSQSSDTYHILDEVESVCAYMYQLDEAIMVLRDNVLNNEQSISDLPFDITFDGIEPSKASEYIKTVTDTVVGCGFKGQLNEHIVPKAIKFGKYYVLSIPYSEIGSKMLNQSTNQTKSMFNFGGAGYTDIGVGESTETDTGFDACMESVNTILDGIYENNEETLRKYGSKDNIVNTIKYNLENITISEAPTPPNITGISEATFMNMKDDLKKEVEAALKNNEKLFNSTLKYGKQTPDKQYSSDGTVDLSSSESIPGCYIKLVDPRQMVPIKIFDHKIGYYYFENYDYSRMGTSITDILTNRINFNDQNMIIDNLVGTILKRLKYGELLEADNDFKSLILNCVLYAERRNNPMRIKFVPCEYVTEFKTNCDENGNGQPTLLKSLIFARLYISLLLFNLTAIFTKSTDTEFYYLKENAITPSFQDQVADIIEQFRNSNIDISSILNGNLMQGNRAINKRYFMSTGTSDQKPFDVDVVSGQSIDIHNDLMTDLKKMAIGATGVPSVAVDYMEEIEFATILKMTNTKTLTRANNIQTDLDGNVDDGITGLVIKLVRFIKPGIIPEEDLIRCRCTLRKNNTINNNIGSAEINDNIATVDNMVETWYKGQNTENPAIIEFEKEEMRKRLIMLMSPSLPWGEMSKIEAEVKIAARERELWNKTMKGKENTDTEA